jgi:RimJ/RimL family protein N-acetyltransferase
LLGFGYWAVEEKASGRYIGELGFAQFKRNIQPSIDGMPELGWALAPTAQGKGYAIEALKAAQSWGDNHFGSLCTVCIIHRDNLRSFRVAEKLGYTAILQAGREGEPDTILARPAPARA